MKLIHISDLHYHRHAQDNRKADALLETIHRKYPDHAVIVTGDISDDGHPRQYAHAATALRLLAEDGRVFIAPGNHDFGAKGNFFSRERARRFDEMLSEPLHQGGTFTGDNTPVVNTLHDGNDRVMLIALDTNLETYNPFDFACGEIGDEQLTALESILTDTTNAEWVKILFFHHHAFVRNDPFMELQDARALMRTIYGRIDVLLFGHKHVYERWNEKGGIPWILASDNSPGKDWAHEITVQGKTVTADKVSLKAGSKKKGKGKKKG